MLWIAPAQPENTKEETAEDDLRSKRDREDRGHHDAQQALRIHGPEAAPRPRGNGEHRSRNSNGDEQRPNDQSRLQLDVFKHPIETRVFGQQSLRNCEHLGENGKGQQLEADHHGAKSIGQGVDVEDDASHLTGPRQKPETSRQSYEDRRDAWVEEEPSRAVHEQEAKMPLAIMPGAQVRRSEEHTS